MELGILKSMVERGDTCPECSSRLRIKLLPEEHQGFANKVNILCEQCIWTDEFYSSKAIDLRCKRPFSITTKTVVAFREIGQGYEGLQKFGTLMNMPGSLSKLSYNDINKKLKFCIC